MSRGAGWCHFQHGADVGVRGWGSTVGECFSQAALALTAVVTEPGTVRPMHEIRVECEADCEALLLVEWLNRIIYEMSVRRMLFGWFEASVTGNKLNGLLRGETIDTARHQPAVEVKAATYHMLDVRLDADGLWTAQCVVDV